MRVAGFSLFEVSRLSPHQEQALRELLERRTPPEWGPKARRIDRTLESGQRLELTPEDYDTSLGTVIRLRLRRALMHAMIDDAISPPAAAQILGFVGHNQASLEDLLNTKKFPNLGSEDFAFLREIKSRLRWDMLKLKEAAHKSA